jgi:hypothetical protein
MKGNYNPAMYDILANTFYEPKSYADFKIQCMILFPPAWKACNLSVDLSWQMVPFDARCVKDIPNNQKGIYSFVVKPGIANHPACAYLLYVGKTDRNFRVRFSEYLHDEKMGVESRRPHISGMLYKWKGYLWFCYANVEDITLIEPTEDALLEAYLPPTNVEMPGKLKNKMAFILGT